MVFIIYSFTFLCCAASGYFYAQQYILHCITFTTTRNLNIDKGHFVVIMHVHFKCSQIIFYFFCGKPRYGVNKTRNVSSDKNICDV